MADEPTNPEDVSSALDTLLKLHTERRNLRQEARTIQDDAGEQRSAEVEVKLDRMHERANEIDALVEAGLVEARSEVEAGELTELADRLRGTKTESRTSELLRLDGGQHGGPAARRAARLKGMEPFVQLVKAETRSVDIEIPQLWEFPERRATLVGSSSLVPTEVVDTIYSRMRDSATILRMLTDVISTPDGRNITFPKTNAFGTASWTAEAAAIADGTPTVNDVTLGAWGAKTMHYASMESIADSAPAIGQYMINSIADSIGRLIGAALVAGDDTGKPNGAINSTTTKTFAGAAAITADEIVEMQGDLAEGYLEGSAWIVARATKTLLRKLKDGDGRFLFQNDGDLRLGFASTMLGAPVYTDSAMPAATTGLKSIMYGDFGRQLAYRTAGSIRIETSDSYRFGDDEMAWKGVHRVDSDIRDESAVVVGIQA